jgi:hypothetical protein
MSDIPTAVERFPRLRQSLLARYSDCALMTAFELRAGIATPSPDGLHTSGWSTHRQAGGTVAHAVIQKALHRMLAEREEQVPTDVVEDLLDRELLLEGRRRGERFAIPTDEAMQLRKTLRGWAANTDWTFDEVAGVEVRFSTVVQYELDDGRRVSRELTGQLDVLLIANGHATVVDHKDTWQLPPARGTAADDDTPRKDDGLSPEGFFQQRFYALLVFRTIASIKSVTLRESYIRRGETREATIWRDQLPRLEAEMSAAAARFDRAYDDLAPDAAAVSLPGAAADLVRALDGDGDDLGALDRLRDLVTGKQPPLHEAWEPSPGSHCRYCPKAHDCPIDPDLRGDGGLMEPDEAYAAAGEYLVAKRVTKYRKDQLMRWIDLHGPIRIKDGKRVRFLGFVTTRHTVKPTAAEVLAAQRAGRDPRLLYRTRTGTEFREVTPDAPGVSFMGDDLVGEFERAAEYVRTQNQRTAGRSR